jgi:hypothetical protein
MSVRLSALPGCRPTALYPQEDSWYSFLLEAESTATNQNLIQEELKRRMNSGNACYHSVQNLLSCRLLSKNIKIRMFKTIILPVILYGYKIWFLVLKEEHRLRVLRRIYGQKRDEVICG